MLEGSITVPYTNNRPDSILVFRYVSKEGYFWCFWKTFSSEVVFAHELFVRKWIAMEES